MSIEVVATGTWDYGGSPESPVWIVCGNFDFWYEAAAADGRLEPGEKPGLNERGVMYYVAFRQPKEHGFWPDGIGFATLEDAQRDADRRTPRPIRWTAS